MWILDPNLGIANHLLQRSGYHALSVAWLADPNDGAAHAHVHRHLAGHPVLCGDDPCRAAVCSIGACWRQLSIDGASAWKSLLAGSAAADHADGADHHHPAAHLDGELLRPDPHPDQRRAGECLSDASRCTRITPRTEGTNFGQRLRRWVSSRRCPARLLVIIYHAPDHERAESHDRCRHRTQVSALTPVSLGRRGSSPHQADLLPDRRVDRRRVRAHIFGCSHLHHAAVTSWHE